MSEKRICAYINIENTVKNMEGFKSLISENTKIIAVIKADGYGHGAVPIAKRLEKLDYLYGFAVATAEEAYELRDNGIKHPILILGYTFKEDYVNLIKQDVRLTVFSDEMLNDISKAAEEAGKNANIHIKLDTGMSRIGIFPDNDGLEFVKRANNTENVVIEGLFTHFARADEKDKSKARIQLEKYNSFVKLLENNGINIPVKHVSNSAGILELKEANLDVVRAGITLYGLYPSDEVSKDIIPLYPVMKLVSHVSFVKTLPAGAEISYGGTYITDRDTVVATIPCGYADGIPRGLSNKGFVLIKGRRARILGRVCMDQFMVDVTDICNDCGSGYDGTDSESESESGAYACGVHVGDEVVLIGNQGDETITAEEVGDISGRFNYELVCDISKRVPRIFV